MCGDISSFVAQCTKSRGQTVPILRRMKHMQPSLFHGNVHKRTGRTGRLVVAVVVAAAVVVVPIVSIRRGQNHGRQWRAQTFHWIGQEREVIQRLGLIGGIKRQPRRDVHLGQTTAVLVQVRVVLVFVSGKGSIVTDTAHGIGHQQGTQQTISGLVAADHGLFHTVDGHAQNTQGTRRDFFVVVLWIFIVHFFLLHRVPRVSALRVLLQDRNGGGLSSCTSVGQQRRHVHPQQRPPQGLQMNIAESFQQRSAFVFKRKRRNGGGQCFFLGGWTTTTSSSGSSSSSSVGIVGNGVQRHSNHRYRWNTSLPTGNHRNVGGKGKTQFSGRNFVIAARVLLPTTTTTVLFQTIHPLRIMVVQSIGQFFGVWQDAHRSFVPCQTKICPRHRHGGVLARHTIHVPFHLPRFVVLEGFTMHFDKIHVFGVGSHVKASRVLQTIQQDMYAFRGAFQKTQPTVKPPL